MYGPIGGWAVGNCGLRSKNWTGRPACAIGKTSPLGRRARPGGSKPPGTQVAVQAIGADAPWILRVHTSSTPTHALLYGYWNRMEQEFRGLKTVGWK